MSMCILKGSPPPVFPPRIVQTISYGPRNVVLTASSLFDDEQVTGHKLAVHATTMLLFQRSFTGRWSRSKTEGCRNGDSWRIPVRLLVMDLHRCVKESTTRRAAVVKVAEVHSFFVVFVWL